jgi:hypothetical protein
MRYVYFETMMQQLPRLHGEASQLRPPLSQGWAPSWWWSWPLQHRLVSLRSEPGLHS